MHHPLCNTLMRFFLMTCAGVAQATEIPRDMQTFIQRRDACDHFRGEEGYDKARQALLAKRLRQYCTGTDAQLARLKHKYSNNPELLGMLDAYETTIEEPARHTK